MRRPPPPSRTIRIVGGAVAALALWGCAGAAEVDGMVARPAGGAVTGDFPLRQSVGLTVVEGGKASVPLLAAEVDNPAFAAALRRSLASADLLAADGGRARYALHATLLRADQPVRGLTAKAVAAKVHYRLQEVVSQRVVFDQSIETRYTATLEDSLIAAARHREANEAAVRRNFEVLIGKLRSLGPADLAQR